MQRFLAGTMLGATMSIVSANASAQASAHAMVVAGPAGHAGGPQFACATSGGQPREREVFNTGVGLPTEGYAYCGLSGGIEDLSGAIVSGVAHQDVTRAFNNGSATLSADASASVGELHVHASGSNTATSYSGGNYAGAEAAAYYSDAITFSGTGTRTMRFQFALDGATTTTGNSEALIQFVYRIGSDPRYGAVSGYVRGSTTGIIRNPTGSIAPTIPGFSVGPGSIGGSGNVYTFDTLVTPGTATAFDIGLYVAAYPSFFGGTVDNDFSSTLRLTGIYVVDGAGTILDTPVAGLGRSGYTYDSTGAHAAAGAVPEPGAWALMMLGLGAIGGTARRRRPVPGVA